MSDLSTAQIDAYLDRISFPKSDIHINPSSLDHLALLQRHQLAYIPFEGLSLHYSKHHSISLETDDLFEKIVEKRKGGYCMENNKLFYAVLRTLGFQVYPAGARVSERVRGRATTDFAGWSHQISIVTINGSKYMVDVGFGNNGPTRPVPLVHDEPMTVIAPTVCRLQYRRLDQHQDHSQRVWVYSFKVDDSADWFEAYAFTEIEFFPNDFEIMNFSTMLSRTSTFVQKVVVQRVILSDDMLEIIGSLVLIDRLLKRKIKGHTEILHEFKNEEDRIIALDKWFGIRLSSKEKDYIKYLASEIA